jgi:hypothetical protein
MLSRPRIGVGKASLSPGIGSTRRQGVFGPAMPVAVWSAPPASGTGRAGSSSPPTMLASVSCSLSRREICALSTCGPNGTWTCWGWTTRSAPASIRRYGTRATASWMQHAPGGMTLTPSSTARALLLRPPSTWRSSPRAPFGPKVGPSLSAETSLLTLSSVTASLLTGSYTLGGPLPLNTVDFRDLDAEGMTRRVERFTFGSGRYFTSASGVATLGQLMGTGFAVSWARTEIPQ